MENLRIQLIERLCRLPTDRLPEVDSFLNQLTIETKPTIPSNQPRQWPHAPIHKLSEHGTYFVTAATLNKEHDFFDAQRLSLLEDEILKLSSQYGIILEAWAIFSNHYHFVAHSSGEKNSLKTMLSHLHTSTATKLNALDDHPGRQVWFNYWDTELTFEKSYFVRLSYVHQNPVKHGIVKVASQYRWCSAAWFEQTMPRSQVEKVYSFRFDRLQIDDDYEPRPI